MFVFLSGPRFIFIFFTVTLPADECVCNPNTWKDRSEGQHSLTPEWWIWVTSVVWGSFLKDVTLQSMHKFSLVNMCSAYSRSERRKTHDQENNVPLCTAIALPLSPFLFLSFMSLFHPSLNPVGPRTGAAELCLYRRKLDTHTQNNLHAQPHTHPPHFIQCLRLIFLPHLFESRCLRVHTNADLQIQKIRHLNSDWRQTHPPSARTLWGSDNIVF